MSSVSVKFDDVGLTDCSHRSRGLDVEISHSRLTDYQLKFHGSNAHNARAERNRLTMTNTNYTMTKPNKNRPHKNTGALSMRSGIVHFLKVNLVGVHTKGHIIAVTNGSEMTLDSCLISDSDVSNSTVFVQNSHITVINSLITNNTSAGGPGFLSAIDHSVVSIANSTFRSLKGHELANLLWFGGLIHADNFVEMDINQSKFLDNRGYARVISASSNVKLTVYETRFSRNTVVGPGTIVDLRNSFQVSVHKTEFTNSRAAVGTMDCELLSAKGEGQAVFSDCVFYENTGFARMNDVG